MKYIELFENKLVFDSGDYVYIDHSKNDCIYCYKYANHNKNLGGLQYFQTKENAIKYK